MAHFVFLYNFATLCISLQEFHNEIRSLSLSLQFFIWSLMISVNNFSLVASLDFSTSVAFFLSLCLMVYFLFYFCMIINEERGTGMHGMIITLGLHPDPFHHHLDMRETIITLGLHPEPFHHHIDMRETTITLGLHPHLFHHHLEMREATGLIGNHYLQEGTVGVHLDLVLTVASDSGEYPSTPQHHRKKTI